MKTRLDTFLVQNGFFPDAKTAGSVVMAGKVLVNDAPVTKPGFSVSDKDTVRIRKTPEFVARSGNKLAWGIQHFQPVLENAVCIDVGASTGGFTDALLQFGAKHVIAIDVAYGFLHSRLRADSRVTVWERKNICMIHPEDMPFIPEFFTVDVSFTSLLNVLPCIMRLMPRDRQYSGIALFKPQFEISKEEKDILKNGVLQDTEVALKYLENFIDYCSQHYLTVAGTVQSPVKGRRGNQEYLVYLKNKP